MKTACIVLNYRGYETALGLARQLLALPWPDKYVFVVDNGSPDDARERLIEHLGAEHVVHSKVNLGYAGGMNVGLKHALENTDAEYFWILTKDLTVEADCLKVLNELWPKLDRPGFLGSVTDLNGTDQLYFFKSHIDSKGRTHHGNKGRSIGDFPELKAEYGTTDYVNGAAVFTSREVLNKVGLIPEDYFLYFEDSDWSLKARRLGYKHYVSYRSRVHHHREVGEFNPVAEYYCRRNSYLFKKRNGFAGPFTKFFELMKLKKATFKNRLKGNDRLVKILKVVEQDVRSEKTGPGPWR